MAIVVKLETVLADRQVTSEDLAKAIGTPAAALAAGDRAADETADLPFSTLEAICQRLDCQPGDPLTYAGKQKPLPLRLAGRFRWVNRL